MTFKGKLVRVIITGEAKEEFQELNRVVGEELSNKVKKSDYQILLKSIKSKIELLKDNPQYGIQIPKSRIPKEYVNNYDAENLWKVNLSNAWRMLYTIRGSNVDIVALILDVINHKDYNKKFNYKKR